MGAGEHKKMLKTGYVQEGGGGVIYVAFPADPEAFGRQAKTGSRYVEFDVPISTLRPGGEPGHALHPWLELE